MTVTVEVARRGELGLRVRGLGHLVRAGPGEVPAAVARHQPQRTVAALADQVRRAVAVQVTGQHELNVRRLAEVRVDDPVRRIRQRPVARQPALVGLVDAGIEQQAADGLPAGADREEVALPVTVQIGRGVVAGRARRTVDRVVDGRRAAGGHQNPGADERRNSPTRPPQSARPDERLRSRRRDRLGGPPRVAGDPHRLVAGLLEGGPQLGHRAVPAGGVLGHRGLDDPAQPLRHAGRPQVLHRLGQDARGDHGERTQPALGDERRATGRRREQRRAERVHVRGRGRLRAVEHLRRRIADRHRDRTRGRARISDQRRDAEVDEHRFAVLVEQDVRRLDVAVHHPALVGHLERAGQPDAEFAHLLDRQRDALGERAAGEQLHGEVRTAVPGRAGGVDAEDVAVAAQRTHGAALVRELLAQLRRPTARDAAP